DRDFLPAAKWHRAFTIEIGCPKQRHIDGVDDRRRIFGRIVLRVAWPIEIQFGLSCEQIVVLVQGRVAVAVALVDGARVLGRKSVVVFVNIFRNGGIEIGDQLPLQSQRTRYVARNFRKRLRRRGQVILGEGGNSVVIGGQTVEVGDDQRADHAEKAEAFE